MKTKGNTYFYKNIGLYLLLLPAMMYYIIFKYIPMYGILIAFQKYNIFQGVFHSQWIGFDTFKEILTQKTFWNVLLNTLRLNIISLIFGFPAPIILALFLNEIRSTGFKRVIQSISYLPHFISWVIVYGMLLAFVNKDTGLINATLTHMGLNQIEFLTDRSWWLFTYVLSGIWKEVGWATILYISAITAIDLQLYEAAAIDGAGKLRCMWNVTLPGIRSTIVIILILNIGKMMSIGFEQPYLMGNAMVSNISNVLSTFIYDTGILKAQFSYTAAIGLFQSVINFILLMLADFISRRLGEDGLFGGRTHA